MTQWPINLISSANLDWLGQIRRAGLWTDGQPLRLHFGCGEQHFEGYVNIDYPPSEHTTQTKVGADVFADFTILDFPQQSVEEIRLHQVFEHFDRAKALALLIRWHEWLKISGVLRIETPDIMGCACVLTSRAPYSVKQAVLRHAFGSHEADWAYHYDGWYDEKFRHVLSHFGFLVRCRVWQWDCPPYLQNVDVTAIKKKHLSREQLLSAADSILRDSMVRDVPSEHKMHAVWQKRMRAFLERS